MHTVGKGSACGQGARRWPAQCHADARGIGAGRGTSAQAHPSCDPRLTFAIARVGGNLNQLSRWINSAVKSGRASQIDALKVAAQLVAIERQLAQIVAAHRGGNSE